MSSSLAEEAILAFFYGFGSIPPPDSDECWRNCFCTDTWKKLHNLLVTANEINLHIITLHCQLFHRQDYFQNLKHDSLALNSSSLISGIIVRESSH